MGDLEGSLLLSRHGPNARVGLVSVMENVQVVEVERSEFLGRDRRDVEQLAFERAQLAFEFFELMAPITGPKKESGMRLGNRRTQDIIHESRSIFVLQIPIV